MASRTCRQNGENSQGNDCMQAEYKDTISRIFHNLEYNYVSLDTSRTKWIFRTKTTQPPILAVYELAMHFFGAQKCTTWHALARALESIDLRNHWPLQILPQIFHPKAHKSLIPQESRGAVESPGAERPTSGTHSKRA